MGLRARAIRVNIDPPQWMLTKLSLGGYGRLRKCKGQIEPIHARILQIENDHASYLFLSIDQVGIPYLIARRIKKQVSSILSVPMQNIFIYATHNHFTPDISGLMEAPTPLLLFSPTAGNRYYTEYMIAKIDHAVKNMRNIELADAEIKIIHGTYPFDDLIERRILYSDKKTQYVHPPLTYIGIRARVSDRTSDSSNSNKSSEKNIKRYGPGDLIALIMISSMHDVLFPPNDLRIIAGLTGNFCRQIYYRTSDRQIPAVGLFIVGPSGNVNPSFIKELLPEEYRAKIFRPKPKEVLLEYHRRWAALQAEFALSLFGFSNFNTDLSSNENYTDKRDKKDKKIPSRDLITDYQYPEAQKYLKWTEWTSNPRIMTKSSKIIFPIDYVTNLPESRNDISKIKSENAGAILTTRLKTLIKIKLIKGIKHKIIVPLLAAARKHSFMPLYIYKSNSKYVMETEVSYIIIENLVILNTPGEPFTTMHDAIKKKVIEAIKGNLQTNTNASHETSADLKEVFIHTASLCNDSIGYMFVDPKTVFFQDGYEPTMTATPYTGTYIMNSLIKLSKKENI